MAEIRIPTVHVGQGRRAGALTVFPVWMEGGGAHGLEWRPDRLGITELAVGTSVSQLHATVRSVRPLVALEGDLLEGGMQDRMVATSVLLAPGSTGILEARCVERGRWSGTGHHTARGHKTSPTVRAAGLDRQGVADQGAAWERIDNFERQFGGTATHTLTRHLDQVDPSGIPLIDGQRGVILGIGGRVIGAEMFGSPRGLAARWDGILAAAALDARSAPPVPTTGQRARDFAAQVERMVLTVGDGAGMARRLRSTHQTLVLSGIGVAADPRRVIHATVWNTAHPTLMGV